MVKHRITSVYTGQGDTGQTRLASGERISKADLRLEVIGTLDECNAALGLVRASITQLDRSQRELLTQPLETIIYLQHLIFDLGGLLSLAEHAPEGVSAVDRHGENLLRLINDINSLLAPLQEFVLPGSHPVSAGCHQARVLVRQAERRLAALTDGSECHRAALAVFNRMADLLFVMARWCDRLLDVDEVVWQKRCPAPTITIQPDDQ